MRSHIESALARCRGRVRHFNAMLDLPALHAYWDAVEERTVEIVERLREALLAEPGREFKEVGFEVPFQVLLDRRKE